MRTECFVTNVVNYRPPENNLKHWIAFKKKDITSSHVPWRGWWVLPIVKQGYDALMAEIQAVQPNVIVPVGNLALHALVEGCIKMSKQGKGPSGILKWRGSQLRQDTRPDIYSVAGVSDKPKVIPTIHPAAVAREWSYRRTVVNDLLRVKRHQASKEYKDPGHKFIIRPSFDTVINTLNMLISRASLGDQAMWLDLDIETRAGHIACVGVSWSRTEALIVPFMCVERREGYWSVEEEAEIIWRFRELLKHPRVMIDWQNGLYDAQYIHRWWHFVPNGGQDTMISHHAMFSDLPKALHFQASMYCEDYVYWKDEGKNWDSRMPEDQLWAYNGLDCVYTRECGEVQAMNFERMSQPNVKGVIPWPAAQQVHAFQQSMFWPVLQAMTRGVRVIKENRNRLAMEVQEQVDLRQATLEDIIGHPVNVDSPKQMIDLFYQELNQPVIFKRREKGRPPTPTCDDDALGKIALREPLLKPITNCISDIRTMGIFLSDFVLAKLDADQRMRCAYNIGGSESGKSAPKTYRLSSSKNAFGSGTNMQTIPSEKSKSVGKSMARGQLAVLGDPYALPNVRSIFGPDPGFTFFDDDLDRADLQVVVWEADDQMLKAALRMGADIHLLNAFVLEGKEPPPLEELVETHPRYPDHRGPRKHLREFAKVFCHATNYLGGARTVAANTGRTVGEVDRAQKIWFGAHPGIKRWHERVLAQIKSGFVENKFGYRWYIFDRLESAASEAVAWIPQSTVSIVINKIWKRIYDELPEVQVLLQVHDSLAGQFPTHRKDHCIAEIKRLSQITIPYDDPLIIPTSISTSEVNWGEC